VIRATQTSGLLMTKFRDGTTAYIDSGVAVQPKPNLNTIANPADLILYTEDNTGASAYAYSFTDDLLPLFAPSPPNAPQRLIRLAPSTIQNYKFHQLELCDGAINAYTIIRTRWKDLAGSKLPIHKPGHSEISVLSMAFVLGADPSGINDHRCISHMYLDPFRPPDSNEVDHQGTKSEPQSSDSSESSSPSVSPLPSFTPSSALSALTPSPMSVVESMFGGEEGSHSNERICHCQNDNDDEDAQTVRRTFHSCLEEKRDVWQGPSRNDLISVGLAASHVIWLAARDGEPELKLASFEEPPFPLPLRPVPEERRRTPDGAIIVEEPTAIRHARDLTPQRLGMMPPRAIRTLKLPMSIHLHEISALALDDANGIVAIGTARSELWLLDYAVAPATLRGAEYA